jgi:hypothetical protein
MAFLLLAKPFIGHCTRAFERIVAGSFFVFLLLPLLAECSMRTYSDEF